jgi:hypothetical protein
LALSGLHSAGGQDELNSRTARTPQESGRRGVEPGAEQGGESGGQIARGIGALDGGQGGNEPDEQGSDSDQ